MSKIIRAGVFGGVMVMAFTGAAEPWRDASTHADQAQAAIRLCLRYACGWLLHADPESGLLPRNLRQDACWNAKDAAADNFPFLALTAYLTGQHHLQRAAAYLLETEQQLTNRVGALPDTWAFRTQAFQNADYSMDDLVFGASEYAKDGLLPLVEWLGPGPWMDRMTVLIRSIWEHVAVETPSGALPSGNAEVCGELLQVMSRMYWLTGDAWYRERCFRVADQYLLYRPLVHSEKIVLRDHGCEIIGGLSEAYAIAAREDTQKHEIYRPALHALLDRILEKGVNEDGMMPDFFHPEEEMRDWKRFSDGWGYVYNAFLTVARVDGVSRYYDAVAHALTRVHKYLGANWEGGSMDGYADTVEGALNLLNRIPVDTAFGWVEESMAHIFARQGDDGILEGWHGDGNAARTAILYALWKTRGATVHPWREDVRLGAAVDEEGALCLVLGTLWAWRGNLCLDRSRHREYLRMPLDYPRINQFPEWFAVEPEESYEVTLGEQSPQRMEGTALYALPLELPPGGEMRLRVRPLQTTAAAQASMGARFRSRRCTAQDAPTATQWQQETRTELFRLLRLEGYRMLADTLPLYARLESERTMPEHVDREVSFQSAPGRRIFARVTLPTHRGTGPFPAVICIHGHGDDRHAVYVSRSPYQGFAGTLARTGIITAAIDVGRHEVFDADTTLMGERLWDLMRCVDYLVSLPETDPQRIGCAGLSLGGEMAMWLGAMDTRIRATVSSGFLTVMNQMERNHCSCWNFEGLREAVDFPDIYGLIAPRALLCQIGKQEPLDQFNPVIAGYAFEHIQRIYRCLDAPGAAELAVHPGAHEVDIDGMLAFLLGRL